MKKLKIFGICLACGFIVAFCVGAFLIWLTRLPEGLALIIGLTAIGGFAGVAAYFLFASEGERCVDVCYKVGDTPDDVRVIAVCDNSWVTDKMLKNGDCYRTVPLNTLLKEATWEDLHYKTEEGYMTVE